MPNGGVRRRILGDSDGLAVRGLALLFGFLFCGFRENGWYYVLEHEGLGEMCDAVAVQNSSRYPAQPELAIIQSRAARALT